MHTLTHTHRDSYQLTHTNGLSTPREPDISCKLLPRWGEKMSGQTWNAHTHTYAHTQTHQQDIFNPQCWLYIPSSEAAFPWWKLSGSENGRFRGLRDVKAGGLDFFQSVDFNQNSKPYSTVPHYQSESLWFLWMWNICSRRKHVSIFLRVTNQTCL